MTWLISLEGAGLLFNGCWIWYVRFAKAQKLQQALFLVARQLQLSWRAVSGKLSLMCRFTFHYDLHFADCTDKTLLELTLIFVHMQKGKKHNKNCVFDFISEKIMVCLHGITLLYRLLTSTCPPIQIFHSCTKGYWVSGILVTHWHKLMTFLAAFSWYISGFLPLHINPLQMQAACNWIIHLCFPSCSLTLFLSESQHVSVSRISLQYNPASSTECLAVKSRLEGRKLPANLFKLCCLASGDMP